MLEHRLITKKHPQNPIKNVFFKDKIESGVKHTYKTIAMGNSYSGAHLSKDRVHRYALWRALKTDDEPRTLLAIGFNPSKADENTDDATITRLSKLAKREGYTRLAMVNLFTYRATNADKLHHTKTLRELNGPEANRILEEELSQATSVLVCWGINGNSRRYNNRIQEVFRLIGKRELLCIGKLGSGHPEHPVRTEGTLRLKPYDGLTEMRATNQLTRYFK